MYLRLRQVCFVARDLAAVQDDLVAVFDLSPCVRDPHAESFGLENVLLPVGSSFFEIVSPITQETTAGRYLDRRNGDGGYMAIFDSDEIDVWRAHVVKLGVREAAFLEYEGFNGIQLHPRDTGGPLLEINRTLGGSDLFGDYVPAGKNWQEHVRTSRVQGFLGLEIQSHTPDVLAKRWASILMCPDPACFGDEWRVSVDNAVLRFVADHDGRGEGLSGMDLEVKDAAAVQDAARLRGLTIQNDSVFIGGVRCYLRDPRP